MDDAVDLPFIGMRQAAIELLRLRLLGHILVKLVQTLIEVSHRSKVL